MVKPPPSPQKKARGNLRPQDEAAEEGEGLIEQARTALEMSLKEMRSPIPMFRLW